MSLTLNNLGGRFRKLVGEASSDPARLSWRTDPKWLEQIRARDAAEVRAAEAEAAFTSATERERVAREDARKSRVRSAAGDTATDAKAAQRALDKATAEAERAEGLVLLAREEVTRLRLNQPEVKRLACQRSAEGLREELRHVVSAMDKHFSALEELNAKAVAVVAVLDGAFSWGTPRPRNTGSAGAWAKRRRVSRGRNCWTRIRT